MKSGMRDESGPKKVVVVAKAESKERQKPQAKGAASGLLKGIKGGETRNLGGDK